MALRPGLIVKPVKNLISQRSTEAQPQEKSDGQENEGSVSLYWQFDARADGGRICAANRRRPFDCRECGNRISRFKSAGDRGDEGSGSRYLGAEAERCRAVVEGALRICGHTL